MVSAYSLIEERTKSQEGGRVEWVLKEITRLKTKPAASKIRKNVQPPPLLGNTAS